MIRFKNKKIFLISGIFFLAVLFLFSTSPASAFAKASADKLAGGCGENQNSFSFASFLNPAISFIENVVKNFGYETALATAPDPDYCGATPNGAMDNAYCSGSAAAVDISWPSAPVNWGACNNWLRYQILSISPAVNGVGSWVVGDANGAGSYTVNGLANNTTYSWSVEGYYHSTACNYDWTASASLGITGQPHGSFTTLNCAPPPTADIKANGSDGPITIPYNTAATISWTSTNVTSCAVSPSGWTGTSGSQSTGNLTANQTYSLSCNGAINVITVPPEAGTGGVANLSCNGSGINVTSAVYAANCGAPTNVNSVAAQCNGQQNCTYTMNFTVDPGFDPAYGCAKDLQINYACSISNSVTVNVGGAPTASISADSTSISYNTGTYIRWSSTNVTSCTVSPLGWTGTSYAQATGNLTSSQTYTVNCSGPGGSASASVTVSVGGAPSLTFTADSTSIAYNTGTTLRWSSSNTTSCTAWGDWSGGKSLSGSEGTGNLTSSKTYNLTCSNVGGSVAKSVTVSVGGAPISTCHCSRCSVVSDRMWVEFNTTDTTCYSPAGYPVTQSLNCTCRAGDASWYNSNYPGVCH